MDWDVLIMSFLTNLISLNFIKRQLESDRIQRENQVLYIAMIMCLSKHNL